MPHSQETNPTEPYATLSPGTLTRLHDRLVKLYDPDWADGLIERIQVIVDRHRAAREHCPEPRRWSESDVVLITYGDSIQGGGEMPLATLKTFLRAYLADTFNTVHLLPFFPYSSDDGFSVIDYRTVNPELGDWPDIRALSEDVDLMFDFVLNHVSRESLWFADFLEHMPPGRDYFIVADADTDTKAVVRPRTSPLLTPVRTRHDVRHVWSTFSKDQIDLNYANPDVLMQALEIMLDYVRQGARILRLDAVAFLWKELGTNCIHLPQTHEIVKLFRDIMDAVEPSVLLLTETNVPHQENISYFGDGDEAHMVYQFSLPPLILHAIFSGNTTYLTSWARNLETPPPGCTYLNFTASHDGIGVRPLEGLIDDDEFHALIQAMRDRGGFVSTRTGADGLEHPYELNISYFDAFREPGSHRDNWHVPRFLLSQTIPLSLKGMPAVYIHSLTATPNDHTGVERTGRTRSINRRKWDIADLRYLLEDRRSDNHKVFNAMRQLIQRRRRIRAFHPDGDQEILSLGPELFGVVRHAPTQQEQRVVALYNVTAFAQRVSLLEACFDGWRADTMVDLISDRPLTVEQQHLVLPPYGAVWLSA